MKINIMTLNPMTKFLKEKNCILKMKESASTTDTQYD